MKKGQRVITPDGPGVYVKTWSNGLVEVILDGAPVGKNGEPLNNVFRKDEVQSENGSND